MAPTISSTPATTIAPAITTSPPITTPAVPKAPGPTSGLAGLTPGLLSVGGLPSVGAGFGLEGGVFGGTEGGLEGRVSGGSWGLTSGLRKVGAGSVGA